MKGLFLYFSYREHLALLSDSELRTLMNALLDYAEHGVVSELTGATMMAFSFIRPQIDRDAIKYEEKCRINRENGGKGGRPPKKQNGFDENPQ